jgi:hypothetical protein
MPGMIDAEVQAMDAPAKVPARPHRLRLFAQSQSGIQKKTGARVANNVLKLV